MVLNIISKQISIVKTGILKLKIITFIQRQISWAIWTNAVVRFRTVSANFYRYISRRRSMETDEGKKGDQL